MKSNIITTSVLVVGAGPAGLGVATALRHAGLNDILVIDSQCIGSAFRSWPKEMKLLTPSFNSNSFGLVDLNAIDPVTSPADFLHTQHPNGESYANYLEAVATHYELNVQEGTRLISIKKVQESFYVETSQGNIVAEHVVWAAGQFFYPRDNDFPGAEHALHSSRVGSWAELEGDEFTIIGGYESGVDAALNLIALGKKVTLLSRGEPWSSDHPDPSRSLSPRTLDRLRTLLLNGGRNQLTLMKDTNIRHIEKNDTWWTLHDQDGIPLVSHTQPILANGFTGSLQIVNDLFAHENGLPVFTEEADESTITSGLFYTGPQLVHRNSLFCFIYKFRARFGVIAAEIARRSGLVDIEDRLLAYDKAGFMNSDLDCCTECECAITEERAAGPEPEAFSNA